MNAILINMPKKLPEVSKTSTQNPETSIKLWMYFERFPKISVDNVSLDEDFSKKIIKFFLCVRVLTDEKYQKRNEKLHICFQTVLFPKLPASLFAPNYERKLFAWGGIIKKNIRWRSFGWDPECQKLQKTIFVVKKWHSNWQISSTLVSSPLVDWSESTHLYSSRSFHFFSLWITSSFSRPFRTNCKSRTN